MRIVAQHLLRNTFTYKAGKVLSTQSLKSYIPCASSIISPYNITHKLQRPTNKHFSTNPYEEIHKLPKYTIFREDGAFSIKPALPLIQQLDLAVNIRKKGRLFFSFTPRVQDNTRLGNMLNWPDTLSVNVGVEDIGKILYGLAKYRPIHFSFTTEMGSRELWIEPRDDGTCKIMHRTGDIERQIVLSAGEVLILKAFLKNSVPQLLAWNTLMNCSLEEMVTSVAHRYHDPYSGTSSF